MMLVREKIRILRKKNGLNTTELGELLGVNQTTISRYENGYVRIIPRDKLEQMCSVFNCDIMDIISNDPTYSALYKDESKTAETSQVVSQEDNDLLEWFHSLPYEQKTAFQACISNTKRNNDSYAFILCGIAPSKH